MAKTKTPDKTRQAPKNLPKKQRCKTAFEILLLLIWVGVAVIASQFVVGFLMILILGTEAFDKPVVTAFYSAISYSLALFLTVYVPPKLLAKWRGNKYQKPSKTETREKLGLKGWPTWTDIGLAPVGFVVYMLLAAGLVALFSQFSWFDAGEAQDVGFNTFIMGFDRVLAFFTLVVVAPVAEEIIFRGWLYEKIRSKLWNEMGHTVTIVITNLLVSMLFGLVHMQWNVGINVFAMSIVLCALREITGTIYAGILLHMLKNGVAFYLLYMLGMGA